MYVGSNTMESFVYFIPLVHLNTNKHRHLSIMENTGNNGSTDANKIDLTNVREVHVYREDGSIKETFWFPITPPPPIVIEDSSDTETEEEEEELQEKKEEEKEKEGEEEEEEEEEEADDKEAEEEEEEEEEETNKRRRQFNVSEPTPKRAARLNANQSQTSMFQPAPSLTEPALEPALDTSAPPQSPLPELDVNMDIIAVMTEHGL